MFDEEIPKLHAAAADDDDIDLDAVDVAEEEDDEDLEPDQESAPVVESRDEMTVKVGSTHPEDAQMDAAASTPLGPYDPPDALSRLPQRDETLPSVGSSLRRSAKDAAKRSAEASENDVSKDE